MSASDPTDQSPRADQSPRVDQVPLATPTPPANRPAPPDQRDSTNPRGSTDQPSSADQPSAADQPDPLDARLLVPAAAGWLTAVLLLNRQSQTAMIAAVIALVFAGVLGLFLRTQPATGKHPLGWAAIGSLVVVAGMAIAAALQTAGLRAGPIHDLATDSATVSVRLKLEGDPSLRQST